MAQLTINNGLYNAIIDEDFRIKNLQVTGQLEVLGGVIPQAVTVISGDGAITVTPSVVALTKGSAAAITIAAPTAAQEGTYIRVYTETAFAHVLTCASNGFNDKGSSGTVTLTNAKGNGFLLLARNLKWWVVQTLGATVA